MRLVFGANIRKDFLEIIEKEKDGKKICTIGCIPVHIDLRSDDPPHISFDVEGPVKSVLEFLKSRCLHYDDWLNQRWEPIFWEPFEYTQLEDALREGPDFWYAWFVIVNSLFKEFYEGEVESIDREEYDYLFEEYEWDIDDEKYDTRRNYFLDNWNKYQKLEL
jgi:hypothetical protein